MHEWRSHTAEVELVIEAGSAEEVFAEAATAFAELVAIEDDGPEARHEVRLEAPDNASLLVAWLEELIFLTETDGFVPEEVTALQLGERTLNACVRGRRVRVDPLVKAATYHDLQFVRENASWRAQVVLDV